MIDTKQHNKYGFIIEEAYVPPELPKILTEKKLDNGKYQIAFRTILQDSNRYNTNNRIYSDEVLREIVDKLQPKARMRALYGELDHPFVETENPKIIKKRASHVRLSNAAILIRDIRYEDGKVIGECETLTTSKGMEVFELIKCKANFGFSLRAFGPIKPDTITGKIEVLPGITPITYDVVSNPSHKSARILEFLEEDIDLFKSLPIIINSDNTSLIEESESTTTNNNNNNNSIITISEDKIPFGAVVNDLINEDIDTSDTINTDDINDNNIDNSIIKFKLDTTNGTVIICKDDKCISKPIESIVNDLVDKYFDNDNDNNSDLSKVVKLPIMPDIPLISKCGIPKYKPLFIPLFDSNKIIRESIENFESNNSGLIEESESISSCSCGCPILEDIEFVESIIDYIEENEELVDKLLIKLHEDIDEEIFVSYEKEDNIDKIFELYCGLTKDEIDTAISFAELVEPNNNNNNIEEDEDYLSLSYNEYIKLLVEELIKEMEEDKERYNNPLVIYTNIKESINELVDELSLIPDVLYEISLMDDNYEEIEEMALIEKELSLFFENKEELLDGIIDIILKEEYDEIYDSIINNPVYKHDIDNVEEIAEMVSISTIISEWLK